jgi:two-component system, OmpR family, alkaline phosphatase synthesis response regulator PhoP
MKSATAARPQQSRVLVVEDERDVAELIRYNLSKEGYDVVVAPTGADALKQARDVHPDLVLLDIMVPQLNGWEVCRRLKQEADTKNIPVIMVTGRVEEGDKVLGFEMGADDYVTKPFSPRELLARIRAVARRGRGGDGQEKKAHVKIGELEIDRYRFEVRMKGRLIELTPKEFELLAILAGAPGRVFGREELLDAVWGRDGFVEPRTVDVHVARLRGKFVAAKVPAPGIETVRGVGYRFRDPSRS